MNRAHKIRLEPTVAQRIKLAKAAGCARFTYNWALSEWKNQYKAGLKPNAGKLKKQFNAIKTETFPWIKESPKDANQQAFAHLGTAFTNFFEKRADYPTFKKKGDHDSFYVSNDKFSIEGNTIRLPKIGFIRLTEYPRFEGKILSCTVSRRADKWYASISYELPTVEVKKPKLRSFVGVDLGLKNTIVLSDNQIFQAPKPLGSKLKKLRRLSRSVSRKVKGSNNRKKAKMKLACLHASISDIRQDFLHKVTTKLCRENQALVIEDLNVKGMLANKKLARALSDVSLGEFRRQLIYKAEVYGTKIIVANMWFPSSKQCSTCGSIKSELKLSDRVYVCETCGLEVDRDLNAALNLRTLGLRETYACGQVSSGLETFPNETNLVETRIKPCTLLYTD